MLRTATFLLAIIVLSSCQIARKHADRSEDRSSTGWYQLNSQGRLVAVAESFQPTSRRPWTVQDRVAKLTVWRNRLFVAVNGWGIAEIRLDNPPVFEYYYLPTLFRYRTFAGLLPSDTHLVCHLYYNSLLNEVPRDALGQEPVSILEVDQRGRFTVRTPDFQTRNPDWELVSMLPDDGNLYYMEWKLSSEDRTEFRYWLWDGVKGSEKPITRSEFRSSFQVRQTVAAALPLDLGMLVEEASASDLTCLLEIRTPGRMLPERILVHSENEAQDIIALPVFREHVGSPLYALIPGKGLFRVKVGVGPVGEAIPLPELPDGFSYTDFLIWRGSLFVIWEEVNFIHVGASGLYIRRLGS